MVDFGWGVIAYVLTWAGLKNLLMGLWWVFSPHRLIDIKKVRAGKAGDDVVSKITGRINPGVPAGYIALGVWFLLLAGWIAWKKVF